MRSIKEYILSDFYRQYGYQTGITKIFIKVLLGNCRALKFLFWFRLCKSKNTILRFIAIKFLQHYSTKYNIDIPWQTQIGPGLYLGHCMDVGINGGTIIGKNCNISHFVSIGTNHNTPAVIGDNVYIGPHVCIIENVKIEDNVTIGAGSVVTKSIPANATCVGVPAKVINFDNPARFITNRLV